jgi:hypothetical protein
MAKKQNKMRNKYFMFVMLQLIAGLLIVACKKDRISADGNQRAEVRQPGNFKSIRTSGATPVFVTYGTDYKVELKGSENLISHYKTIVTADELVLQYDEDFQLGKDDLNVYVTLPTLNKFALSGSAKVAITGNFPDQQSFSADVSGSGDIRMSGTLKTELASVTVTGSGNGSFKNIVAKNAIATVTGSGNIRLSVTEKLKGNITGSGNIYYSGSPIIESAISGSGKIAKD